MNEQLRSQISNLNADLPATYLENKDGSETVIISFINTTSKDTHSIINEYKNIVCNNCPFNTECSKPKENDSGVIEANLKNKNKGIIINAPEIIFLLTNKNEHALCYPQPQE